jgi:hypothetical protein
VSEEPSLFQVNRPQKSVKGPRRAWVRYPNSRDTLGQPILAETDTDTETGWPAKVQYISAGGLGLLIGRRFEPGTTLIVEPLAAEGPTVTLPVEVLHASAQDSDFWQVGCKFVTKITDEQLNAFP